MIKMKTRTKTDWSVRDCWVASFDILGFKNLVNVDGISFDAQLVQADYEQTLTHLEQSSEPYSPEDLSYFWLSDTFVIFTNDAQGRSYSLIQQAAKRFITNCFYSSIPIRGAISVGSLITSDDNRSVMGKAFIDAFVTGEDQDWLGLLLTAQAIAKARSLGLEPSRHDFVASPTIPMRKCNANDVMAYRFQNGSASFRSPLIPLLESMMQRAGATHEHKYQRTVDFINAHYRQSQ
ncbi:MAG: hypothetical protein Q8N35_07430 [Methylococcaceae bacterium]|nr:hypothetical protein [Methylococcaceae bacterium]MDP3019400.1 hypothetical protein [Methylococcaceae bacterium]